MLPMDEADTPFGRRPETRDAHDRYANAEIKYPGRHIEDLDGIAPLATNLAEKPDRGRAWHMQYAAALSMPETELRRWLWRKTLSAGAPRGAGTARTLAATLIGYDNFAMSGPPSESANVSLGILASEAQALYEKAKRMREEMDRLPQGDPQRALYEKTILDLLDSAQKLSIRVSTTASKK